MRDLCLLHIWTAGASPGSLSTRAPILREPFVNGATEDEGKWGLVGAVPVNVAARL